jgi:hypothetical protein
VPPYVRLPGSGWISGVKVVQAVKPNTTAALATIGIIRICFSNRYFIAEFSGMLLLPYAREANRERTIEYSPSGDPLAFH